MAPRVALIGSEFEENLSLRYLAAAAAQEGFESVLIPFNDEHRVAEVVPIIPGIYRAEVLLDYGADGIAFDTLMLEVAVDASS